MLEVLVAGETEIETDVGEELVMSEGKSCRRSLRGLEARASQRESEAEADSGDNIDSEGEETSQRTAAMRV